MKFQAKALGLAAGSTSAVAIFLLTNASVFFGGSGGTLSKLALVFRGYSVTMMGSVVGAVWAFVAGFLFAWLFAWVYNRMMMPESK